MLGLKSMLELNDFLRVKDFLRDRAGNFGIMTAILLPCILGAGGLAVDFSSALNTKAQMGSVADSASLAAASSLTDKNVTVAQAKQLANDFARGQIIGMGLDPNSVSITVDIKTIQNTSLSKKYDVAVHVNGTMNTSLSKVLGFSEMDVSNFSRATSATGTQNSMSMYLVLDRSGSMQASAPLSIRSLTKACTYYYLNAAQTSLYSTPNKKPCYYYRIEVLQDAVKGLLATLEKADPEHKLIRTGADAYSSDAFTPQDLDWGVSKVGTYVDKFDAEGGTNSTAAFKEGVDSLLDAMEDTRHKNVNGLTPKKYILLMTDGENNSASDDTKTLTQCKRAKDAGITVYTVGFMLASTSAKNFLLKCASSPLNYYDATDGALLNDAFATVAQQTSGGLPLLTQ